MVLAYELIVALQNIAAGADGSEQLHHPNTHARWHPAEDRQQGVGGPTIRGGLKKVTLEGGERRVEAGHRAAGGRRTPDTRRGPRRRPSWRGGRRRRLPG